MAQRFKLKIGRLTPQEHQEFISELALDAMFATARAEGWAMTFAKAPAVKPRHNV